MFDGVSLPLFADLGFVFLNLHSVFRDLGKKRSDSASRAVIFSLATVERFL